MRFVGDRLAQHGFPVRAIQLPGHGTRPEDLLHTRWADWFGSVRTGLDRLRAEGRPVALVGMSMGALLSLHCAAFSPEAVAGRPFASKMRRTASAETGGTWSCSVPSAPTTWTEILSGMRER